MVFWGFTKSSWAFMKLQEAYGSRYDLQINPAHPKIHFFPLTFPPNELANPFHPFFVTSHPFIRCLWQIVTNVSHLLSHPGTLLTPFWNKFSYFYINDSTWNRKMKNHDYPRIISSLPFFHNQVCYFIIFLSLKWSRS